MRDHKVWEAFGYSGDDCRRLERIAQALVREGATDDITKARRAIAAITWRPLCYEIINRKREIAGHLQATLHSLDHDAGLDDADEEAHDLARRAAAPVSPGAETDAASQMGDRTSVQPPAMIDLHGVKITVDDARQLADDQLIYGNAFIMRAADGTGRRIDPRYVRIDHLEGTLHDADGSEVEALQLDEHPLDQLERIAPAVPRLDGEGASQSPRPAGYTCALGDRAKSQNAADFRSLAEKVVRQAAEEPELLVGAWFVAAGLALWLDGYRWWTALLGAAAAAIALAVALQICAAVLGPSSTRDGSLEEDGPTTRGNG